MGTPLLAAPSECPVCGKDRDILGDHTMSCLSGATTGRHNIVRDELFIVARACGFTCTAKCLSLVVCDQWLCCFPKVGAGVAHLPLTSALHTYKPATSP